MNLYNKAIYLGDNRLDASNRKLSKILIGLLLMLLGGIVIFFSIFALVQRQFQRAWKTFIG